MLLGAQAFGFQAAIIVAGLLGLVVAMPLMMAGWLDRHAASRTQAGAAQHIPMRKLLTPTVIGLVGFFVLLSA